MADITRESVELLIADSEKVGSALSLNPTPFQLEQASNFNTVTIPQALRKLQDQLESAQDALCAAWWQGVHGQVEEIIAAAVTPEMRVDFARRQGIGLP